MKVSEYVYNESDDYVISEERQNEMISKLREQIRKGTIGHFQILAIGQNNDEYDFLYKWLDDNNITIRGTDGTISGEIPNFKHTSKMGQSHLPESGLTPEQEKELFKQLKEGEPKQREHARDILIISYMRLAQWVGNWGYINELGIPKDDKNQMAMIGLINAVDKYDYTKGDKFATYARKVISRRIVREWYMQNPIKVYTVEQIKDMEIIEAEFEMHLGRKAEKREIAERMGVKPKRVEELQEIREAKNMKSLEEIMEEPGEDQVIGMIDDADKIMKPNYTNTYYIEDGVYYDEPGSMPDSETIGAPQRYKRKVLTETIESLLDTLTIKEAKVLRMRFGMYDGNTYTAKEVAAVMGMSDTTIRNIEKRALGILRHPSRSKLIRDFYVNSGSDDPRDGI